MKSNDPASIIRNFNNCINNQDLEGLAALMSADHVFIDSSDDVHNGKELMVAGWKQFFEQYPDYRNHFKQIEARGDLVLITGHSTCAYEALDGPALWTAKVREGQVQEWRVYLDTPENRRRLQLSD